MISRVYIWYLIICILILLWIIDIALYFNTKHSLCDPFNNRLRDNTFTGHYKYDYYDLSLNIACYSSIIVQLLCIIIISIQTYKRPPRIINNQDNNPYDNIPNVPNHTSENDNYSCVQTLCCLLYDICIVILYTLFTIIYYQAYLDVQSEFSRSNHELCDPINPLLKYNISINIMLNILYYLLIIYYVKKLIVNCKCCNQLTNTVKQIQLSTVKSKYTKINGKSSSQPNNINGNHMNGNNVNSVNNSYSGNDSSAGEQVDLEQFFAGEEQNHEIDIIANSNNINKLNNNKSDKKENTKLNNSIDKSINNNNINSNKKPSFNTREIEILNIIKSSKPHSFTLNTNNCNSKPRAIPLIAAPPNNKNISIAPEAAFSIGNEYFNNSSDEGESIDIPDMNVTDIEQGFENEQTDFKFDLDHSFK